MTDYVIMQKILELNKTFWVSVSLRQYLPMSSIQVPEFKWSAIQWLYRQVWLSIEGCE